MSDKFIETRKKLSCRNAYTAKGILMQGIVDHKTAKKGGESVIKYMESNCPDILEDIKRTGTQIRFF